MKDKFKNIIIGLVFIFQIFNFLEINKLHREISRLNENSDSRIARIEQRTETIYSNVDNMLNEEISLIEEASLIIGELNKASLEVELLYDLTPKEVRDKTQVFLDFNGNHIEMKRDNTKFTASIHRDVFQKDIHPKIIIKEDDLIKTTQDFRLEISDLKRNLFPEIGLNLDGSSSYTYGKYSRTGDLLFTNDRENKAISFKKAKLIVSIDDRIFKEEDINIRDLYKNFTIDEEIPLKGDETCIIKISFIDDLNLRHDFILDKFNKDKGSFYNEYLFMEYIYSENGDLLWKGESI